MTGDPGSYAAMIDGKVVELVPPAGSEALDYLRARQRLAELTGYPLPPESPTWMKIRGQAMGFDYACDAIRAATGGWTTASALFAVPYIVNSVFFLELSLKALLVKHDVVYRRVHLLIELYEMLPEAGRAEIEAEVARALAESPIRGTPDVVAMLQAVNDGFREWRYAYETDPAGGVSLLDLRFLRTLFRMTLEDQPGAA